MDIKRKIKEFNKRWNVTSTSSYEEEFRKFKTRVLNIFGDIDAHVSEEEIIQFCQILGIPEDWEEDLGEKRGENIINALKNETNEKGFYFLLEVLFALLIRASNRYARDKYSILLKKLTDAIELSNINLAVAIKDDEIVFYPRGEKKLDKKLVDEPLSFLNEASQKHFVDALHFYQKGTPKNAIKSAESLRRCVEEFLRFKLQNRNGFNANIKELRASLKQDDRDPAIRNIIYQTLSYLDQYFNENSKHKDGNINEAENEFLIYQVGLLMRYIDKTVKGHKS